VAKPRPESGRDGGSVGSLDAHYLTRQFPGIRIDNHNAIVPPDEQAVVGRIRHDVVPVFRLSIGEREGHHAGRTRKRDVLFASDHISHR
jgi:hypothetical protein